MCDMPDPEEFAVMAPRARDQVFYTVLQKLSSRARFVNTIFPSIISAIVAPAVWWIIHDSMNQEKRIEQIKDRVDHQITRDSVVTTQILLEVRMLREEIGETRDP